MRGPRGLRFRPPALDRPPGLGWLLAAAFAPVDTARPAAGDGARTADLAARLGLLERIAARLGASTVAAELGGPAGERFLAARRQTGAVGLLYEGLARRVAAAARRESLPILFLKGFALRAAGLPPSDGRPFADLDLLAPIDGARTLARSLEAEGLRREAVGNEHHLGARRDPGGGAVEIHYRLRGLAVGTARWATLEAVLAARLARPAEGLGSGCWRPRESLFAAHALVHGIDQHSLRPTTYPALRWIADLVDLLPDEMAWSGFTERHLETIEGTVSRREVEAAANLCQALIRGAQPGERTDAGRLLDHLLAGALDDAYCRRLRLRHRRRRLVQAARDRRLLDHLGRKLGWIRGATV